MYPICKMHRLEIEDNMEIINEMLYVLNLRLNMEEEIEW